MGVGLGWSLLVVLTPASDPLETSTFTVATVATGDVESSMVLSAVAQWVPAPVGANRASGVVTEVSVEPGTRIDQGTVLYRVDQRPVVAASGEVPAFRAIGRGAQGVDVVQLQRMLAAVGAYGGPDDGTVGAGTVSAIRRWQKLSGVPQTGVVELNDVIFIPHLPVSVILNTDVIVRGSMVSGGESVVQALPAAPTFSMPVTDAQAGLLPLGTRVEIASPAGSIWVSAVSEMKRDESSSTYVVALQGEEGGAPCGGECDQVPAAESARLVAKVVMVPAVTGLIVPSASLISDAKGRISVIAENGNRVPVEVIASARGMSVVQGVESGMRVRVPAIAPEAE